MLKKPSIQEDRRLEILGILLLAISAFIFVSLLGYDPSEEPSIMPSVNINNPMGILGVVVSHVRIVFLQHYFPTLFFQFEESARDSCFCLFFRTCNQPCYDCRSSPCE